MKAEKKAAEKEAKVKDQDEQSKEASDKRQHEHVDGVDEETLDPNVRRLLLWISSLDELKC